jgi:hypothetical protein
MQSHLMPLHLVQPQPGGLQTAGSRFPAQVLELELIGAVLMLGVLRETQQLPARRLALGDESELGQRARAHVREPLVSLRVEQTLERWSALRLEFSQGLALARQS